MNIKRLLFYYCVFVATALAVYLVLFAPRPQGILLFVLFTPVPIFFWKRVVKTYGKGGSTFSDLASPGGSLSKKELRNLFALVLLTSVLVSASTVVAYSRASKPEVESASITKSQTQSLEDELYETSSQVDLVQMSNEAILRELKDLKRELTTDTITEAENTTDTTKNVEKETMLKINTASPIDIYEDKSYSSKVIGKSEKSIYPYTQKVDTWYLILLPNGTEGWVSASFVTEL